MLRPVQVEFPSRAARLATVTKFNPIEFFDLTGIEAPGLDALAAGIDAATSQLGVAREKQPFAPHLTLARIKERLDLRPLRATIAGLPSLGFGQFEARSFFLYQSALKPTGSVYTKLAEFPLSK